MRKRTIKPTFYSNEILAKCKPLARILFTGLWCYADREGLFEWRPERMKVLILPFDKTKIEELLDQLIRFKFIVKYESEAGGTYGWIPEFKKNQPIHPHEAKSVIPLPSDDVITCHYMSCNVNTDPTLVEDSNRGKGIGKDKKMSSEREGVKEYAPRVFLKSDEYTTLCEKYSIKLANAMIEKLDGYKEAHDKEYVSDYGAINHWVAKEVVKERGQDDKTMDQLERIKQKKMKEENR